NAAGLRSAPCRCRVRRSPALGGSAWRRWTPAPACPERPLPSPAWIDWDEEAPCACLTDSVTVLRKNVINQKVVFLNGNTTYEMAWYNALIILYIMAHLRKKQHG